ncbi:hypothetical protein ACWD35_40215, partial [Streptomyces sp. NPDC002671]
MPEPTAHTPTLAAHARELLAGLGLQRARVRALAVRAERLRPWWCHVWPIWPVIVPNCSGSSRSAHSTMSPGY